MEKYNPFDARDNPSYDPNELLSESEVRKTKYWYILHNGKYFEGDINDPIWAGDRYEIICCDVDDFNNHFASYNFSPIQSQREVYFDTRWNNLSNDGDFARGVYFGKIYRDDKVVLEINLAESRFVFNKNADQYLYSSLDRWTSSKLKNVFNLEKTDEADSYVNGIPSEFRFSAMEGTNSIILDIGSADNAYAYWITVDFPGSSGNKTYTVSSDKLKADGYRFVIHSRTADSSGGFNKLYAGRYTVNVKALGYLYGVEVSKPAVDRNIVMNVPNSRQSGGFGNYTGSVTGGSGSFLVNLAGSVNTEYYAVRLEGPLNPEVERYQIQKTLYYANDGFNRYDIESYPSSFQKCIENQTPGVYKVSIFPVNNSNCTIDFLNAPDTGREQYISVAFEKYASQKSLRARKSQSLSDFEAVNIQANFNDGSGWHDLRVLGDDVDAFRDIDCRYKKYYDAASQKFFITFDPPKRTGFSLFDIFTGGRDYVDLYLRAVPKEEYRDRFWPKPESLVTVGTSGLTSFASLWCNNVNGQTDATDFEAVISGSKSADFTLSSSDKNDYFFSPCEYRLYGVTVKLDDSMYNLADSSYADDPKFGVSVIEGGVPAEKAFFVRNIHSSYCSKYYVYYKDCGLVSDIKNENDLLALKTAVAGENPELWSKAGGADGFASGSESALELRIAYDNGCGILPNHYYAVAVTGMNAEGKKSAAVKYIEGSDPVTLIVPRCTSVPAVPNAFILSLKVGSGSNDVTVSNIYSADATDFQIRYKRHDLNDLPANWNYIPSESAYFFADTFDVMNITNWTEYDFSLRASNRYDGVVKSSGWSDYKTIDTNFVDIADNPSVKCTWTGHIYGSDNHLAMAQIKVPSSVIPAGTVSYSAIGNLSFDYHLSDNYEDTGFDFPDKAEFHNIYGAAPSTDEIVLTSDPVLYWRNNSHAIINLRGKVTFTFINNKGESKSVNYALTSIEGPGF